ncbi:atp4 subunit B of the stator stalk of mitochondrial F1F0 ATP synthase [Rhizophlyctis rosea]|uniref:ATP synthase subunit 4 n=1 Tax=Rhizophlyctis rosea TaxID=64517 RepID=A0AAD5S9M3_9FUNG|nr:atp4 subunit B of the stator stalk of mitochondrial F1F0 ATP synthase [Rhizophlyctis rosea]
MASRLVSRTAMRTALSQSVLPRQVAAASRGALIQQKNQYATETTPARPEPKAAAEALINRFPGQTLAQKSGTVLVVSSIAAYLISKEIYIIDAETFEMGCIFGAYYLWYNMGKESAAEYFKERRGTIKRVLEQAREEHKTVVQERIAHITKMDDLVDVTKGMFEMSKEIAKLEAEAYELKQKVAFTTEIKSTLDAWVRHEASIRDSQQRQLVQHVIDKIKNNLQDPRLQQQILAESVAEVDRLTKGAAA